MTKISKEGLALIKEFEGCCLKAYPDPLSGGAPWTIGYGTTRDENGNPIRPGTCITHEQAEKYLIDECEKHFLPSLSKIPDFDKMSSGQQGALLSFAYNLGAGFYGSGDFNTITRVLRNKEWDKVPNALMLYVNPGTNVEAGLRRRRKAEGDLWARGINQKPEEAAHVSEIPATEPKPSIETVTLSANTITATEKTYLKKRPRQASELKDFEKVVAEKDKVYSCKLIESVSDDHCYVILDHGAGTWYIYKPHWELTNRK